jgi:DNA-directed RNA polymerase specialized sigma24 family protein
MGEEEPEIPPRPAADLFEVAQAAAQQGRPDRMLEALDGSGFLDGLVRRLERKWGSQLPRAEIEDCVAGSVDNAYDAIRTGRSIRNLGAWLWKVADNAADDRWRGDYRLRYSSTEEVPERLDRGVPDKERAAADELADQRIVRWRGVYGLLRRDDSVGSSTLENNRMCCNHALHLTYAPFRNGSSEPTVDHLTISGAKATMAVAYVFGSPIECCF